MPTPGTLYLVATPIGNLGDISYRAADTLKSVDFIAAEDTRVTIKLLNYLEIKKSLVSYYEHNSRYSGEKIISRIIAGENCALVTDAGMPGISDPGHDLTRLCVQAGITLVVIPGPCAAVSALVLSGFETGRFTFEGFLSTAQKSRFEHLEMLQNEKRTMIFYEAPHKLLRTLKDMASTFGADRRVSISREMTKIFEETLRFNLAEACDYFEKNKPRGEFVLVVEGVHSPSEPSLEDAIRIAGEYMNSGLSVKDSVKAAALETNVSKNMLYDAVVKCKDG
jgi:16S rRNA (cytidine1402-2'-O)-methyltransferase